MGVTDIHPPRGNTEAGKMDIFTRRPSPQQVIIQTKYKK